MPADVLIVDDDVDLRSSIGDYFDLVGHKVSLQAGSLEEARRLGEAALGARLAIVDINLGENQATGMDVVNWLLSSGFQGRIVFLTGHAREHPLVKQAAEESRGIILQKPIAPERLTALLEAGP